MAENETSSYLKQHGLSRLVTIFEQHDIRMTDFPFLRNNHTELQQLLPKLRDRIDFLKLITESSTKSTQADLYPPIICRETLLEICSKNDFGRAFLDGYKNVNGRREYSPESRVFLKNTLVEYFYRLNKGHITHINFMEMIEAIRNELPDEDPRTWYIPPIKNKSGGGLLYNRYRYVQHTDKRFKQSKHETEEPGPSGNSQHSSWETLNSDEKAVCEAAKHKLQVTGYSDIGITGYSDIGNITTCWKQSFPLRRKEALAGEIIFREWEVLVHFDNVHELINYDFRTIHSIANDTLALHATTFVKNFNKLFQGYRSLVEEDKSLYDTIVKVFDDNVHVNDTSIFLAFFALPLILRQPFVSNEKKRVKVSTFSCRMAYITNVETEARILEIVAERRKTARALKSTIQPFMIVAGTIDKPRGFFVILDDLIFKCKSMIAVIDLHFKLHTVFHLVYAKECETILQFIQIYFYNIHYPGDRFDSSVTAFASDCKRL